MNLQIHPAERGATLLGLVFFLGSLAVLALVALPGIASMVQTDQAARLAGEGYRIDTSWKLHAASSNSATLQVQKNSLVLRMTAPSGTLLTQRQFTLPSQTQVELRLCTASGCSTSLPLSPGACESLAPTGVPQASADCVHPAYTGSAAPVVVLCRQGECSYATS